MPFVFLDKGVTNVVFIISPISHHGTIVGSVVMKSADSTELRHYQYRETGYHRWGKTGEWENKNRKKMCIRNANLQS